MCLGNDLAHGCFSLVLERTRNTGTEAEVLADELVELLLPHFLFFALVDDVVVVTHDLLNGLPESEHHLAHLGRLLAQILELFLTAVFD